jgi:hypothetical protein
LFDDPCDGIGSDLGQRTSSLSALDAVALIVRERCAARSAAMYDALSVLVTPAQRSAVWQAPVAQLVTSIVMIAVRSPSREAR